MKIRDLNLKARRSTRIILRMPVRISTQESSEAFDARTMIINKHGASFECQQPVNLMQEVLIAASNGNTAKGQVVWANTRPNSDGNFEFAVELDEPTNIFGLSFPPYDWEKPEIAEWSTVFSALSTA